MASIRYKIFIKGLLAGVAAGFVLGVLVVVYIDYQTRVAAVFMHVGQITDRGATHTYTVFGIKNQKEAFRLIAEADRARRLACQLLNCSPFPLKITIDYQQGSLGGKTKYSPPQQNEPLDTFRIFVKGMTLDDAIRFVRHEMAHVVCDADNICSRGTVRIISRGPSEIIPMLVGGYWPGRIGGSWLNNLNFDIATYVFRVRDIFDAKYLLTTKNYPTEINDFYGNALSLGSYLLIKEGGFGKWKRLLQAGADRGINEQIFKAIYGMSFAELERRWERWKLATYPKTMNKYAIADKKLKSDLEAVIAASMVGRKTD